MNWVDAAAIIIVILSALFSLVRGFVREALGVGAWLGAGFAAVKGYPLAMPFIASLVSAKNFVMPLSIAVIFIAVLIILSIVSAYIGGLVSDSPLSSLNRSLGLVFGAVRGAIILSLGYIGLSVFVVPAEWPLPVIQARLLPYVYQGATLLAGLLPPHYQPTVLTIPTPQPPTAGSLMQQPVAGSAIKTE